MRFTAPAVAVLALVCFASGAARGQQVSPSPLPAQDASGLTPVFVLQHRRYVAGEAILVSVGLKNTSSQSIDLFYARPWDDCSLTVIGLDGRAIAPGLADIGDSPSAFRSFSLRPGVTQFVTLYQQQWYPLDRWSYHLTAPGRYRITVRATASGANTTNVDKEQSTVVTLTIDP
jgi:hypothetical protein